jgi:hypothetical protein
MASRLPEPRASFQSTEWLAYFERDLATRERIDFGSGVAIEPHLREPLIRSLQRFQVGESGEGEHLLTGAAATGDPVYAEAVRLFVAEEQEHARMLAGAIRGMGGTLLDGHWSDRAFVLLRRLMGLRLELLVLLIAELIARRYYRALYDGTSDPPLRAMYAQIMRDEVGHVSFHLDYLRHAFADTPAPVRVVIQTAWALMFRATCLVVLFDHRSVLRACNVPLETFWHDCGLIFSDAATRIFGNRRAARQLLSEQVELV